MLLQLVRPVRIPADDMIDALCEETMEWVEFYRSRKANWVTRRSGPQYEETPCPREA